MTTNELEYRLETAGDDYVDARHELQALNELMMCAASTGSWTLFYWRMADRNRLIDEHSNNEEHDDE